ncbi:heterokaryon incompatibility protein-domain-containing protein [Hygrophoropsis aurantiaca]|uniref:Heterokaryon incompatibility protein-domain-containing protein n=1 Tax=Hygrophoropsis aurantiaca TaxID=72124 RepID=A0ACB7ZWB5_9AGAM|nr:heterokaryon incompatibility protein-domain-containing protein [Hygrophoropsis aurantiaca]
MFDSRRRSFKDIARTVIALGRRIPTLKAVVNDSEYAILSPDKISQEAVKSAIQTHVDETLANIPLHLFNTYDGKLYSHAELRDAFQASTQYDALLLLTTSQQILQHTGYIREIVRSYFEYAMLSHRWEGAEPLYADIQVQSNIYHMTNPSGITKLQNFCHVARARGFRWAWSDTCCIDKTSSAELQKSIASMFAWYRHSGLTIVYLADVSNSSPRALEQSLWFQRGWTLQELLAPRIIQFYLANWQPVVEHHYNHKAVDAVVDILVSATGIDKESLINFVPGVHQARLRISWAANRRTKEVEDVAYSLMGIFDLHLPVIYGEKEAAFGRLLTEIIGRSDDITLLDWVGRASSFNSCLPAHPDGFKIPALIPARTRDELTRLDENTARAYYERARAIFTKTRPTGPSYTHGKLSLSCIAYKVKTLKAHYDPRLNTPPYRFDIYADGLEPLCICTADRLEEIDEHIFSPHTYSLARVCDDETFGDSDNTHDNARTGLRALAQPFVAMLLRQTRGVGSWRRIPTTTSIITSIQQLQDIQNTPDITILHIS